LRADKLSGVGASPKISLAAGMGILSAFPRLGRWVEANHIIASGGGTKRQGPTDIAKAEHGHTPSAEPGCGRKNRL
jgi:hypothetical protein